MLKIILICIYQLKLLYSYPTVIHHTTQTTPQSLSSLLNLFSKFLLKLLVLFLESFQLIREIV